MGNDDSFKFNDESSCVGHRGSSEADHSIPKRAAACQAGRIEVREYVAPRNEVEAGVADILAGMLMIERVGIHDNFILLGGESLRAAQAAWRIRDRFGCEVALRSILAETVAEVAAEILAAKDEPDI